MKLFGRFYSWYTIVLTVVAVGILVGHTVYISKTRQYPQWDEHHYVSLSRSYFEILHKPSWDMWQKIIRVYDFRQPLYPLTTALVLFATGPEQSYVVSLFLNGIFFVITIFAVYSIGRVVAGASAGFISAILYAGMGFPLFYTHFAYTETATAMWVALSLYFLVSSDGFSDRKMSVYAAVAFIAGMMTRWVTPIFVFGVFLWELFLMVRAWKVSKKKQRKARIINTLLFIGLAILIPAALYYIPNFKWFIAYTVRNNVFATDWITAYKGAEYTNPFSVKTLVFYMNTISQNSIYYYILFVIGSLISIIHWKKYGGLLLTFLIAYGIFSVLFLWKDDRFMVPLYPAIAVLSGLCITVLRKTWIKTVFIFSVAMLGIISYFGCEWGVGPMGKRGLTDIVLPRFIPHPRRIYLTSMVWPPVKEYINADQVANKMKANRKGTPITASVFLYHEPLNNALSSIENYYTKGIFRFSLPTVDPPARTVDLMNNDFIVVRHPSTAIDGSVSTCFNALVEAYPDTYRFLGDVTIPSDGSVVWIYKNENVITESMLSDADYSCINTEVVNK